MSPSEELRQAAARIREVAGKATPGPWVNYNNGDRIIRDPDIGRDGTGPCGAGAPLEYVVDEPLSYPENGDHLALWDPIAALAVADWLDDVGDEMADEGAVVVRRPEWIGLDESLRWGVFADHGIYEFDRSPWKSALVLARAINEGGQQ